MKKFTAILVSLILGLSLVSCSSGDEGNSPEVVATGAQATEANLNGDSSEEQGSTEAESFNTYVFQYNGTTATVDMRADAVISGFGEGYTYFESNSCAFQGMDKVYTYTSFLVRTYPMDDVDYILSIELRDDSVSTPEGIYIGSSEADVRAIYGDPTSEGTGGIEYTQDNCTLSFVIVDGNVSAISYNRVG